jgi:hypothetical protein
VGPLGRVTEAIVVAGGGLVAGDDGRDVEYECAEVVNAAAHSFGYRPAVGAAARCLNLAKQKESWFYCYYSAPGKI